jgi:hypothetical protein
MITHFRLELYFNPKDYHNIEWILSEYIITTNVFENIWKNYTHTENNDSYSLHNHLIKAQSMRLIPCRAEEIEGLRRMIKRSNVFK